MISIQKVALQSQMKFFTFALKQHPPLLVAVSTGISYTLTIIHASAVMENAQFAIQL
jgi:hypothetical protein